MIMINSIVGGGNVFNNKGLDLGDVYNLHLEMNILLGCDL